MIVRFVELIACIPVEVFFAESNSPLLLITTSSTPLATSTVCQFRLIEPSLVIVNISSSEQFNRSVVLLSISFSPLRSQAAKVVRSEAGNFTLDNSGTIDAYTTTSGPSWLHGTGKWTVYGTGASTKLTNSGTITAEDIYTVWLEGASAEVINTNIITAENNAVHLEGASAILNNSGEIKVIPFPHSFSL